MISTGKKRLWMLFVLSVFLVRAVYAEDRAPITIGFLRPKSLSFEIDKVDSYEAVFVIRQIAQTLIEQNASGKTVSSVAKYWTISKDLKTYKFYLRDSIYFHNGDKLTAADVQYSINTIRFSRINPLNIYLKRINEIKILDPKTIQIDLKEPWFGFLHCLASGLVPIFSSEAYHLHNQFVGSGPYKLIFKDNSWLFVRFETYVGPYQPREAQFKILTVVRDDEQPDILVKDLTLFPKFSGYQKLEVDSFMVFNFMINPQIKHWRNDQERLMLIKALLEAKEIVKTPRLSDLMDIFPRGMLGFDIKHKGFDRLMARIDSLDPIHLKKKSIRIGSLGSILNFQKLADRLKQKYGIDVENIAVEPPDYLEKMRNDDKIDVFTIGWTSIFSHPDATFVPFYILGLKDSREQISAVIESINHSTTLSSQYEEYRKLSFESISNGYILPHSQLSAQMYVKPGIFAPRYRYRYTLQLAEIERKSL